MCKYVISALAAFAFICFASAADKQQSPAPAGAAKIHLTVESGTPLRLYLLRRTSYREGQVAQARTAEAVWAFDRVVIPAGTLVTGTVSSLQPVSKMARTAAIVRGDFTPLKVANLSFDKMTLPDGQTEALLTRPAPGLASIYVPPKPGKKSNKTKKSKKPPSNSRLTQTKDFVKRQAMVQANSRSRGVIDFIRGQNKREWIENMLWSKLPYHPQWYRSGTRVDAVLQKPLDFGSANVPAAALQKIGSDPPPQSSATVRFAGRVSSEDAKVGDPIQGVLSEPLFDQAHELVLPAGTELAGKVTLARRARMFHRGGQLRFAFNEVKPDTRLTELAAPAPQPTFAQLTAGESSTGPAKVDEEGTAKATESKARLLRPIVAGLIAARSLDNDEGRTAASGGASANYSGRSLGGFSGFGLFGTAASFGPRPLGAALGFYGLAWSVYSTVVSRGRDVTFEKDSALAIRFAPANRRR